MATLNHTSFTLLRCILVGIPGMEASHSWISIPFCSMYMIALLGNGLLLFIIIKEQSLHKPMYLFLAMLAVADVLLSTATMPKMLSIFWFNAREITFSACFTQMFFIHFIFVAESAILLAMAFDRYVAICDPLKYTTILTLSKIWKIAAASVIRGVLLVGSLTFFLKRLSYCGPNVIYHTFCVHMGIAWLACADITLNIWYGLTVALLTTGLDVLFIVVSYILILQAVFRLPSKDARLKTIGTCSSHIWAILMFYIPVFFSIFAYRFGGANIPHYIRVLLANIFVVVPPMLNPIVYGVRTRQIRERVIQELCKVGKWF
ncbi:olfactory receptor 52Z1P-like [Chelonoidis abingdonii]|uniref:olfactory receptor 52Z1P-like n=1 Tax=Chelonoidis abingdonii TaxID=106734 RepID=UPI0013F2B1E0|nr:olfactory receptor 52Z1-like [Chelonoidis abingdonii]